MHHTGERKNIRNSEWENLWEHRVGKLVVDQDEPHVTTTCCILWFQMDQIATGYGKQLQI